MIQRKLYMNRILPFIDTNLVKIITGIRRSGKSIMLQLIQQELEKQGVPKDHMLSYNFEFLAFAPLCTAQSLYQEVVKKTKSLSGKVYLFLMKSRKCSIGKRQLILFGWIWMPISILQGQMRNFCLVNWQPI